MVCTPEPGKNIAERRRIRSNSKVRRERRTFLASQKASLGLEIGEVLGLVGVIFGGGVEIEADGELGVVGV